MKTVGFQAGEILLPRCDLEKWSVVACDQFTSQPEYWEEVERIVGDAPSAYRLIFPEALLSKVNFEEKIDSINQKMEKYWNEGLFQSYPDAMIYVERTLLDGSVRKGILGLLDLEEYDYRKGSGSLVRATEGTVMERIPPRVQIREHALLELPHVLVLVDDPEKAVVEPVAERRKTLQRLYDFRLMQGGGRIRGWLLDEVERERVTAALEKLGDPEKFREKYGVDAPVLLYAVGDGNHSLASAKECWNRIKAGLSPEEAKKHPARYALVELGNLHDDSLKFEAIHRVIFGVEPDTFREAFRKYADSRQGALPAQTVRMVTGQGEEALVQP